MVPLQPNGVTLSTGSTAGKVDYAIADAKKPNHISKYYAELQLYQSDSTFPATNDEVIDLVAPGSDPAGTLATIVEPGQFLRFRVSSVNECGDRWSEKIDTYYRAPVDSPLTGSNAPLVVKKGPTFLCLFGGYHNSFDYSYIELTLSQSGRQLVTSRGTSWDHLHGNGVVCAEAPMGSADNSTSFKAEYVAGDEMTWEDVDYTVTSSWTETFDQSVVNPATYENIECNATTYVCYITYEADFNQLYAHFVHLSIY
ncbi:uncharacterized protein LOC134855896, partial [Symsagittifera roscoffensis]|uniref:uncharacterized protein LOC134855896 n=1 Tax=Symsagittifera roscoffensis TaxID=84072 RepID=UPI00307C2556